MKIKGGSRTHKRRAMHHKRRTHHKRRATHHKHRTHHKRRTHRKRRKGGSVLATAALPFGLFGLQKLFQKGRTRRQVRRVGKVLKKDLRKLDVRRYLK
jgi:hypothetical protein